MKKTLLLLFLGFNLAFSQKISLRPFQAEVSKGTREHLKSFELLRLDAQALEQQIDAIPGNIKEITLSTPNNTWTLQLFEYSLLAPNCVRRTGDINKLEDLPKRKNFRTFRGYIKGQNSIVSLSIGANGFFKVMIDDRKDVHFIEPLDQESLSADFPMNQQFLFYKSSDINPEKGISCGVDQLNKNLQKQKLQLQTSAAVPCKKCVIVKIAIAADYTMFVKYGNNKLLVEDQILSVLADVQTVYDDEFANSYEYEVTGMYIPDAPNVDLFKGITDINAQLNQLSTWALTLFSGSEFNVATSWSAKWRTGTTGVAAQSSMCNIYAYNVCSDFVAAGGKQGVYLTLWAHMLGHNWSMIHDAAISPTIMAPDINGSKQWSALSIQMLDGWVANNHLIESFCLKICPNSDAPQADFISDVTYGCLPLTVHYSDQSLFTTSWKWSFPGGTPSTSTLKNPTVVYNSIGTFEVSLESANNRCAVSITKSGYIEVNDVPTADFSFGINPLREVFFTNYSQRGYTYLWKFGDGEESDEKEPVHVYPRDTSYEVTLIVTNDCGTRSLKKKINVVSNPVADFVADTTQGCAPKIIKFSDKSSNNVIKWIWNFPGGNPSFSYLQNPFTRYDNPGVYDVELTVLSSKTNHTLKRKLYITIDSLPDAEFNYQINGNTISFTNQSRYSKSHFWDFGDNATSTDSSPVHTYLEGRYEVLYVVSNGCGSDTATTIITVGSKPIAGFQVNDHQGCLPFKVQFANTSTAAATAFKWYFPGGNPLTSTDKNPLVTYNSEGKFTVSLFAYNNFFSDSIGISDFIEVKTEPTASFSNTINGFKSFFTHQAKGATNYFWDFGDGRFSFEENPNHDYGVEGEFDVQFIVQNECGLDTFSKHIAVYLVPKVNFTADTIRGCAPLKVKFTDKSSIDVTDWEWQFENGNPSTSNQRNPEVVFPKKGRYSVKLNVKNTNGSNQLTRTQYIQVLSPVLCPENTKTNRFMVSENPLGANFENRADQVAEAFPIIFPNPAQDYIYVISNAGTDNPVEMNIYDLSGRLHSNYQITDGEFRIATNQLASGAYYIKFKDGMSTVVRKFVISE